MRQVSNYIDEANCVDRLENDERLAIFDIQTEVLKAMVERLVEKGFSWILPVILAKSTDPLWPDPGSSIEKRIEVEIYGKNVRTMQSMIIHKRVLSSLGPEKFFTLSPNIRIEKKERAVTGWHLYEFTQLDLEVANAKMEDMFTLFDDLIETSISKITNNSIEKLEKLERRLKTPKIPFKVYKSNELADRFGDEWEAAISKESSDPVWVTDIPREFYDYQDEKTGVWKNFDLILPDGYGELISGSEREYDFKKIVKKIEKDRLDKNDYQLFMKLAKEGRLKPSAGAGLGVERFIAYICGVKHVAEVQPFPRVPGIVPEL